MNWPIDRVTELKKRLGVETDYGTKLHTVLDVLDIAAGINTREKKIVGFPFKRKMLVGERVRMLENHIDEYMFWLGDPTRH